MTRRHAWPTLQPTLRYGLGSGAACVLTVERYLPMRRLIDDADFFNVPNVEPTTVILDGFTRRLSISVGRRQHEVIRGDGFDVEDSATFQALVAWVEERTPPLFGRLGPVDE